MLTSTVSLHDGPFPLTSILAVNDLILGIFRLLCSWAIHNISPVGDISGQDGAVTVLRLGRI